MSTSRNPPVLVEQLGDTHRAEYFEHYHRDRLVGVYVDVYRNGMLDGWHRQRGPYKSIKTARQTIKMAMRYVSLSARQGAELQ